MFRLSVHSLENNFSAAAYLTDVQVPHKNSMKVSSGTMNIGMEFILVKPLQAVVAAKRFALSAVLFLAPITQAQFIFLFDCSRNKISGTYFC